MAKDYAKDVEQIEAMLDISSARVQQNVKVVTPDDFDGRDVMLHISSNTNIRKFIPSLTLRGSPQENRDITRVCVGPTLLGCMIGYAQMWDDVHGKASDGKEDNNGYKGGWKIYALPFKACLKPNTKMVYDVKYSDEHWLVTYNEETKEYIPQSAGRFFWSQITVIPRAKKYVTGDCVMLVEITLDEGIMLGKKVKLEKGYWKLEGPVPEAVESWKDDEEYTVTSISKAAFDSAKKIHADLLSHREVPKDIKRPNFLDWV